MSKKDKITVQGTEITVILEKNNDYICLTDMVKGQEGEDHIRNWMRNRNTLEFLGAWEMLHNPTFKGAEFDTFLHEAGANRFNMTPRKWIEATDAVGIISKAGRNGGTYAHKDIAFEFGSWLSPVFKLYLITEYHRLKELIYQDLLIYQPSSIGEIHERVGTEIPRKRIFKYLGHLIAENQIKREGTRKWVRYYITQSDAKKEDKGL